MRFIYSFQACDTMYERIIKWLFCTNSFFVNLEIEERKEIHLLNSFNWPSICTATGETVISTAKGNFDDMFDRLVDINHIFVNKLISWLAPALFKIKYVLCFVSLQNVVGVLNKIKLNKNGIRFILKYEKKI